MKRYLVTGGAGFIGSNLVEAILKQGDAARILDNLSTGRRSNLDSADQWASAGGGSWEMLEGDIRDPEICKTAMDGVDYVLQLAAMPSVKRSVLDPVGSNEVNVGGTLNILMAARDAGVSRLVFSSSSSLYGESETLPKVESMPPNPISPYALQKLAGETYCRLFWELFQVPTVALRYFNVFGPRQDPTSEYSAVIPAFISAIKDGRTPVIYGDGGQTRDFTYIQNVVEANLGACVAGEKACGRAMNIACGDRISLNDLLEALAGIGGVTSRADYQDPREGDIRHSLAGIELAGSLIDYHPVVSMQEGLRKTWDAY
jgi:nucleoside-diphosphate-sugar epimerase